MAGWATEHKVQIYVALIAAVALVTGAIITGCMKSSGGGTSVNQKSGRDSNYCVHSKCQ